MTMCCGGGFGTGTLIQRALMSDGPPALLRRASTTSATTTSARCSPLDGVLIAPGIGAAARPGGGRHRTSVRRCGSTPSTTTTRPRIIEAGRTVTVEIHYTGKLENGQPIEFDAIDVFDLDDDGRIVRLSSWYDSHAVRRSLRAALEQPVMVGPPPASWAVPARARSGLRAGAGGVAAAAAAPLAAIPHVNAYWLGRLTSACSSTAGRRGTRAHRARSRPRWRTAGTSVGDVRTLVVTHAHSDHVGLAEWVIEAQRLRVPDASRHGALLRRDARA